MNGVPQILFAAFWKVEAAYLRPIVGRCGDDGIPAGAHHPRGPVPGGLFSFRAGNLGQAYPNARPHRCFTRDTVRMNQPVVAEHAAYQAHPYEPSTLRPACGDVRACSRRLERARDGSWSFVTPVDNQRPVDNPARGP